MIWHEDRARTSFALLHRRISAGRGVALEARAHPAHLVCFDILEDAGTPVMHDRSPGVGSA